ncbi:MAG: hypothetical protein LIO40_05570 [Ruminococcus sp.]|nr:hypothetical protein [Ruminococcus sp.]
MSYQSEYSGKQMEAVFKKINNMVVGKKTVKGTAEGFGTQQITNASGHTDMSYRVFVNVHPLTELGSDSAVSAAGSYSSTGDTLTLRIYGSGVHKGTQYTVDYMLIE